MSRTRFLAAIAVAALLMQLLPTYADAIKWAAIGLGILYLSIRAALTYPAQYRQRKRLAAQRASDEREYREYDAALAALRIRHADAPADFERAVAALHDQHRGMLERKFKSG